MKNKLETEPAHDEVAKKAYSIYLKEGRPLGHADSLIFPQSFGMAAAWHVTRHFFMP